MTAEEASSDQAELARHLAVLSNEVRLRVLHRLASPAFVPELVDELGITRQALQRHLDELVEVGLVEAQRTRRGALPAFRYVASPAGLFAFKERVRALALPPVPAREAPMLTRPAAQGAAPATAGGAGLLLVHGDAPGRWFPLADATSWTIGRDAKAEIRLHYDPFASGRHALIERRADGWRLVDLQSTNGTWVNFERLPRGAERAIAPGDLITIGNSQLLLRGS